MNALMKSFCSFHAESPGFLYRRLSSFPSNRIDTSMKRFFICTFFFEKLKMISEVKIRTPPLINSARQISLFLIDVEQTIRFSWNYPEYSFDHRRQFEQRGIRCEESSAVEPSDSSSVSADAAATARRRSEDSSLHADFAERRRTNSFEQRVSVGFSSGRKYEHQVETFARFSSLFVVQRFRWENHSM